MRKDCARQLLEPERFHAVQELQAPNTDIEQAWFWSEFLDSNIHWSVYIRRFHAEVRDDDMPQIIQILRSYIVISHETYKKHYENRSVSMRESINLLWLKPPCYDLTLRQRFHAGKPCFDLKRNAMT